MTDVAFAAGFESIRQFNDTVRAVFALTPTELRERAAAPAGPRRAGRRGAGAEWAAPQAVLPAAAVSREPVRPPGRHGDPRGRGDPRPRPTAARSGFRSEPGSSSSRPSADHVACRLRLADLRDLSAAIARCRWLLDLDADPEAIDGLLSEDPGLRPLVVARSRPAGAAYRGRRRDGDPRGARPADLDRRRAGPRRAAGRPARRAGVRSGRRADPRVPAARGAVGDRARDARRPPRHRVCAARRVALRRARPQSGRRPRAGRGRRSRHCRASGRGRAR